MHRQARGGIRAPQENSAGQEAAGDLPNLLQGIRTQAQPKAHGVLVLVAGAVTYPANHSNKSGTTPRRRHTLAAPFGRVFFLAGDGVITGCSVASVAFTVAPTRASSDVASVTSIFNPHSPDDALINRALTPIQI